MLRFQESFADNGSESNFSLVDYLGERSASFRFKPAKELMR